VSGILNAKQISVGDAHACVVLDNGSINCWGSGNAYKLGNASTSNQSSPVYVSSVTNAISVSAGETHTCALLETGSIKCWGAGSYGQLGNGSSSSQSSPVSVSGISNAKEISSGSYHSCALLDNNTAQCWGYNNTGQLGNDSTSNSSSPVTVNNLDNVSQISAGQYHTCALISDGTIACWGYNNYGQLGNDSTSNSSYPDNVSLYTDRTPPTGSITINNKSSYSRYSTRLNFNISSTDAVGVKAYYTSKNDTTPSLISDSWKNHSSTTSLSEKDLSLSVNSCSSSCTRYVYIWFKDEAENISDIYQDSVYCYKSYYYKNYCR